MPHDFDKNDASDQDAKRARRTAKALRDILRKTFAQGGDARHNTEELLRAVLGEVKIPREYANVILQQINATRGELLSVVAGEVRTFLDDANLGEELAKILTSLSFEIRTEIRFIPNEDVLRPSVKSRVGVKSTRPKSKSRAEPDTERDDDDDTFVETRGSAAIDKAIQSRVASLASMFIKGIVEGDDDDVLDTDLGESPAVDPASSKSSGARFSKAQSSKPSSEPSEAPDADIDETEGDDDEEHRRGSFGPRDLRLRMSLGPDFRRRAEAAATQVATAGRATASLSAATAASAVSAAATRAQAVVRGGRNLTTPDARDIMWKRWVGPNAPDLVGNPVIGARADYVRPEEFIQPKPAEPAPVSSRDDVTSEQAATGPGTDAVSEVSESPVPASTRREKSKAEKEDKSAEALLEDTESSIQKSNAQTRSEEQTKPDAERSVAATSTADVASTTGSGQKAADINQGATGEIDSAPTHEREESGGESELSTSKSAPVKSKPTPSKKAASASSTGKEPKDKRSTGAAAKKKAATSTGAAAKKKVASSTSDAAKKTQTKARSTVSTPTKSATSAPSKPTTTAKSVKPPSAKAKPTTPSKPKLSMTSKPKSNDAATSKSSESADESTTGDD